MHASVFCRWQKLILAFVCVVISRDVQAEEPLHQQINQMLARSTVGPVAGNVDDLTFSRRLYLDLAGRIPSPQETREFLSQSATDRRTRLVDQLLAGSEFPERMATVFDIMLMERRGGKHIKTEDFRAWLKTSFQQNKPYHQLASELIGALPSEKDRVSAAFLLERDMEPTLVTREIGRIFFGMDLQCAQCHDHPNVDDYKQEDYYGLHAFVSRTSLFQADPKKPALIADSAEGQAPFKSVFTSREAFTSPRMPGEPEIVEPIFNVGEELLVRGTATTPPVPVYSRRAKLAELLAIGSNQHFRRNIANRLWALMLGRGLVHPVDMHHSMNPPSHPELMALLADRLAAMNFNVPAFLRELALTEVYQRSCRLEETPAAPADQLAATIQHLEERGNTARQLSIQKEQEAQAALAKLDEVLASAEPLRAAWDKARAAATGAARKHDDASGTVQAKKTAADTKQTLASTLNEALQSTKAAADLLSAASDLSEPMKVLSAKAKVSESELKKLQKEMEAAATAAKAAEEVLAKARMVEMAEREKFTPLQQPLREHRAAMVQAFQDSQRAYILVTRSGEEVNYLKNLVLRSETTAQLPSRKSLLGTVEQQRISATRTVTDTQAKMTSVAQLMTAAESRRAVAQSAVSRLAETVQQKKQAALMLSAAIGSTKMAATALSEPVVVDIVTGLEKSAARVADEMATTDAQLQSAVAQQETAIQQIAEMQGTVTSLRQQAQSASEQAAEAGRQSAQLQAELAQLISSRTEAETAIIEQSRESFQVASVESLSPEQLGWSLLYATGQMDRQVAAELAKLNKEMPLTEAQLLDASLAAQRQQEARKRARVELTKTVAEISRLFAAQNGQPQDDFFATVEQALYFSNGSQVLSWLAPNGDNLTGRLSRLETAPQIAEELYLSVFVRQPSAEEMQDVADYLSARSDKKSEALQELAWALITSAEFRFQ